jgi:hypothetical protein
MSDTSQPTKDQASIVEVMARAGFRENHERKSLPGSAAAWKATSADWLAVTGAMITALEAAGFVVVPANADEAMQLAGAFKRENGKSVLDIWLAMVGARPR